MRGLRKAARFLTASARIVLALLFLLAPLCSAGGKEDGHDYVTSRSELMKALADKRETVYVGDIDFEEDHIRIAVRQSVRFVGKAGGSVLHRARFSIEGPEVESELYAVSFENIVFDGCYETPDGDPSAAASFGAFYGDRTDKGCLTASGYLDLSFCGCVFTRYCSSYGAAMYLHYSDGNRDIGTRARLTMRDCSFAGNICEKGVFWCNGQKTKLEMTDCSFSGNRAYSGVVVLGGVDGVADGLAVKNNLCTVFTEKNTFFQSSGTVAVAQSELLLKNSVIEGNAAPRGGGLMSVGSVLTVDTCRFVNNTAETFGGGLLLYSSETAPIYITNCLIAGNRAAEEGAVWVWPADQIGIGLPTGIVEFSFCTIENNRSDDDEHLAFHRLILECESSTVGPEGKVDFIACRITDDRVTPALQNGVDGNIVNSEEKGDPIPAETVKRVANGTYANVRQALYAGVNELAPAPDRSGIRRNGAIAVCAAALLAAGLAAFLLLKKKKAAAAGEPDDAPAPETAGTSDGEETERLLRELANEKGLTGRELDVLREYVSGKTRIEIAQTLFISESTVKNHISSIFAKLGVGNKKEFIALLNGRPAEK